MNSEDQGELLTEINANVKNIISRTAEDRKRSEDHQRLISKTINEQGKIIAVHDEKLKTHSRFILGTFSLSSLSGVLASIFMPGK